MTEPELIVILPESKERYAELLDADLLYIAMRHLQTICEVAQIDELSISNGPEMLTANFVKLKHRPRIMEPMGIVMRKCGAA